MAAFLVLLRSAYFGFLAGADWFLPLRLDMELVLFPSKLDVRREQQQLDCMPKRKEPELTPAEQYKRFKEAAKKAGVTKDEEEFERAFKKVAPTKRKRSASTI